MRVKKALKIAFIASLVAAVTTTSLLFVSLKKREPTFKQKLASYVSKNPEKTDFNVLVMGYGGAGHSGGGLSDANILVNIDTDKKLVNLITLPRDLWIEGKKFNASFADGGGPLAKNAAKNITGLEINNFIAIDFNRFKKAIDALGGITVDVPVSFTDKYFPVPGREEFLCDFTPEIMIEIHKKYSGFELEKQFECRYETLTFNKGSVLMDGETTLKFVRSRHSSEHGGDFARGEREQEVVKAIARKLVSLDALKKIDKFYKEFFEMVDTDVNEEAVLEILPKIGDPSDYKINNINITTDNLLRDSVSSDGQYILVPKSGNENWSAIHAFVKNN